MGDSPKNHPTLPTGLQVLGEFIVGEPIQDGPFWTTYRAMHVQNPREFFHLRSLRSFTSARRDIIEAFARQSLLLQSLKHPGLVPVVSAGVDHGAIFTVSPEIAGQTLRERLNEISGGIDPGEVGRIVSETAALLEYLHKHSPPIAHRALEPDRIFLAEPDRTVKVLEVGLAHALEVAQVQPVESIPRAGDAYRAPEDQLGQPVAPSVDQYSLATIAYECLTGTPLPPEGLQDGAVDPAVARVLARALSPDPTARYPSPGVFAGLFALALAQIPRGQRASVVPPEGTGGHRALDEMGKPSVASMEAAKRAPLSARMGQQRAFAPRVPTLLSTPPVRGSNPPPAAPLSARPPAAIPPAMLGRPGGLSPLGKAPGSVAAPPAGAGSSSAPPDENAPIQAIKSKPVGALPTAPPKPGALTGLRGPNTFPPGMGSPFGKPGSTAPSSPSSSPTAGGGDPPAKVPSKKATLVGVSQPWALRSAGTTGALPSIPSASTTGALPSLSPSGSSSTSTGTTSPRAGEESFPDEPTLVARSAPAPAPVQEPSSSAEAAVSEAAPLSSPTDLSVDADAIEADVVAEDQTAEIEADAIEDNDLGSRSIAQKPFYEGDDAVSLDADPAETAEALDALDERTSGASISAPTPPSPPPVAAPPTPAPVVVTPEAVVPVQPSPPSTEQSKEPPVPAFFANPTPPASPTALADEIESTPKKGNKGLLIGLATVLVLGGGAFGVKMLMDKPAATTAAKPSTSIDSGVALAARVDAGSLAARTADAGMLAVTTVDVPTVPDVSSVAVVLDASMLDGAVATADLDAGTPSELDGAVAMVTTDGGTPNNPATNGTSTNNGTAPNNGTAVVSSGAGPTFAALVMGPVRAAGAKVPRKPEPKIRKLALAELTTRVNTCPGHEVVRRHARITVDYNGTTGAPISVAIRARGVTAGTPLHQCMERAAMSLSYQPFHGAHWSGDYKIMMK